MDIVRLQKNVAIMIDGRFFLQRFATIFGPDKSAKEIADKLEEMVRFHLAGDNLYRIFYYDSYPEQQEQIHPVSGEKIQLGKEDELQTRMEMFEELKSRRKLALRINYTPSGSWVLAPNEQKTTSKNLQQLAYQADHKGVEIGVDVATLSLKKQVEKIILIAGDADFVPAAKMARYEGVDFVLDPMWQPIPSCLYEHIDGLKSVCPRPERSNGKEKQDNGDAQPKDPHAHEKTITGYAPQA